MVDSQEERNDCMVVNLVVPDHLVSPLIGLLKRGNLAHLASQFGHRNVIDANKVKLHFLDILECKVNDYQI
jgi:hypothetical protein